MKKIGIILILAGTSVAVFGFIVGVALERLPVFLVSFVVGFVVLIFGAVVNAPQASARLYRKQNDDLNRRIRENMAKAREIEKESK